MMTLRDKLTAENPSTEATPGPLSRGEKLALAQQIRTAHPARGAVFGTWFKPAVATAVVALVAAGGAALVLHKPDATVRIESATTQPAAGTAVPVTLGGQRISVQSTIVPEGSFGVHGYSLAANHSIDDVHRSTQEVLGGINVTYVGSGADSFSVRYTMTTAELRKTSLGALRPYQNLAKKGAWQEWAANPSTGLPAVVALAQQARDQQFANNRTFAAELPALPRPPHVDLSSKEKAWSALTQWLQYPGFTAKDRAAMLTLLYAAGDGKKLESSVVQEVPGAAFTQPLTEMQHQDAKRYVMVDPATGYLTGSARVLPGSDFLDETGIDTAVAFKKPVQKHIKPAHLGRVKELLAQDKCTFEQGTLNQVTVQESLCIRNEPTTDPNTGKPMTTFAPNASSHWQLP